MTFASSSVSHAVAAAWLAAAAAAATASDAAAAAAAAAYSLMQKLKPLTRSILDICMEI